MTGFIVPNTADAAFFDQAEPDAGDFFALGRTINGVLSGLVVTSQAVSAAAVDISAGTVLLNNTPVDIVAASPAIAAGGALARFDAVVVNDLGSVEVIKGVENAAPRFPDAVWTRSIPPVLLAAIYRPAGASTVVAGHVIDKRILLQPSLVRTFVDPENIAIQLGTRDVPTPAPSLIVRAKGALEWTSSILQRVSSSAMEFLTSLTVQTTVPGTPSLVAKAVSAGGGPTDHVLQVQAADGTVLANIDAIGRIETRNIIYGACPLGPEGIFSAEVGTIFINSGDNTTVAVNTGVYYKANGSGLTGWVALASVDPSVGAVPVGGMIAYTGSETTPPTGWVWADGLGLDPGNAAYNALRTKYAGNPYGIDANGWTRKPNAIGRSLIGLGATWAPGGIGTLAGTNQVTLTQHELPNHGHINFDVGHRHGEGIQYVGHKPSNQHTGQHFLETSLPNEHAYWFEMPMTQGGGYIVPIGDGAAFSIMNPYILVRVMVKL